MSDAATSMNSVPRYKRKMRNYLLDAGLQLRYTAVIVLVAVFLTSGLGYMIYQATRDTSKIIAITGLVDPGTANELQSQFASKDRTVLWGIVGFGLVLVFSVAGAGILITHKIAGPLFNIANSMNRVRDNHLGALRQLRKGDELQEFFGSFRDMHEAVRKRLADDVKVLAQAIAALEATSPKPSGAEETLQALRNLRAEKERSLEA